MQARAGQRERAKQVWGSQEQHIESFMTVQSVGGVRSLSAISMTDNSPHNCDWRSEGRYRTAGGRRLLVLGQMSVLHEVFTRMEMRIEVSLSLRQRCHISSIGRPIFASPTVFLARFMRLEYDIQDVIATMEVQAGGPSLRRSVRHPHGGNKQHMPPIP